MPVFVLDTDRKPLSPCHPAVARKLLATGKAAVLRLYPFTILLKRGVALPQARPLRLKLDPGSRVTGLAVIDDTSGAVLFAAEVEHRGQRIRAALADRRALRRARRNRKTRYRKPRFDNRRRPEGWLPPSLSSRVANVETWVGRLRRVAPIGALSLELNRFDPQALQNAEIRGVAYQQGTLAGYEVREYLLEKWQRRCVYCDAAGLPLEVEHLVPQSRGGTNRVSNLCLACETCNQAKGNRPIEEFLSGKPNVLAKVLAQAKAPLKDAAVVNATRWELFRLLKRTGLPVEAGTGGRTKYNRTQRGLPKAHWIDAACVGASTPERLQVAGVRPLAVKARGWGRRKRCNPDRFGFPRGHAVRRKACFGFRTGDLARAVVPRGKHVGVHVGRVAVRMTGRLRVGNCDGLSWKQCRVVHRMDGYDYGESGAARGPAPAAETAENHCGLESAAPAPPLPLKGRGFHAAISL
jgi:5-methylcytosine-specific restriction endonuclease McrA